MSNRHNENMSPGKWALLIIIHVVGCELIRVFELAPGFFPQIVIDKTTLGKYTVLFAVYMLVQYSLVQLLIGGKNSARKYHFRLCILNLLISISSVLTLPLRIPEDDIIGMTTFIFLWEGIALISVLLSTAITILRTRKSKRYSPSN